MRVLDDQREAVHAGVFGFLGLFAVYEDGPLYDAVVEGNSTAGSELHIRADGFLLTSACVCLTPQWLIFPNAPTASGNRAGRAVGAYRMVAPFNGLVGERYFLP